jgi:quercetin dioxygenase-like cupin family protein
MRAGLILGETRQHSSSAGDTLKTFSSLALAFVLCGVVMAQQSPVPVEEEPHHHVLLKNESVLVMRVTLQPGESTLFHTHSHDRAAIDLSDSRITLQKLGEPESAPQPTKPGDVSASELNGPYTHRVNNVGSGAFEVLDVELLHRPMQPTGTATAKVEAENPSARIYKWTLAPGASSAMHTHERPYLIVSATPLVLKMTDPEGKSFTHEVKAGDFHWVDAKVTHSLANEGTTAGQIVEIELK